MKKLLGFFYALSIFVSLNAQYKQPQWLMPLFFTDGNGERDTVYIGYAPEASSRGEDIDASFDEGWQFVDTSIFNVWMYQYPWFNPLGYYIINTDSFRKSDIRSVYIATDIGFIKGKMPITLKWVDSLLNSPSLPFPDISPRPRARIDLYCGSGEPGYITCPVEYEPITLTNYITPDLSLPVSDSLFFSGSGSNYYPPWNSIGNMHIEIVPHNYSQDNITKEHEQEYFRLLSNPFDDKILIYNKSQERLDITLINSVGLIIQRVLINDLQINIETPFLSEGVYILVIRTKEKVFIIKTIKIS